jgi:hypothetical protein
MVTLRQLCDLLSAVRNKVMQGSLINPQLILFFLTLAHLTKLRKEVAYKTLRNNLPVL